ncbi:hypothetical protein AKJ09_03479 [Labilithrix luteola]|uniref:Uncharacterized protein n=1 Tax=Labilithrix luteola TaxID=1391654 RepID=A0A0K1PTG1_9BACT|nr:hypothetical protein [Labilithrix luteola]AKU96815.1 hypothetical protein AKJ09_03479 [Labilithrix luteola]
MRIDGIRSERIRDEELERPAASRPEPRRAELLARNASTPHHDAFYASLRESARAADPGQRPSDTTAARRLDEVRDAYAGPYLVDGQQVAAPPMFRMNGGANQASMERHASELDALAAGAHVSGFKVRMGIASPDELVKVTQALINAGKLPPGSGDVASRIRQMQWEWGIGVDCANYTRTALLAATGATSKQLHIGEAGFEAFRGLDRNKAFTKVSPAEVRPGDIVTLDPKPPEVWGHNVIVRSRDVVGPTMANRFAERYGDEARSFMSGPGPVHVIAVDSSWGAGPHGASYGGYRRDTWFYDESTSRWGYVDRQVSPPKFQTADDGPADTDRFHGAYRPRAS